MKNTSRIREFGRELPRKRRIVGSTEDDVAERTTKDITEDRVNEWIGHGGTVTEPRDGKPNGGRDTFTASFTDSRNECTDEERCPQSNEHTEDNEKNSQGFAFIGRHEIFVTHSMLMCQRMGEESRLSTMNNHRR